MKNAAASLFVLVVLTACASYTWTHTKPGPVAVDGYESYHWREQVKRGF